MSLIPKKIYQSWKTKKLPLKMQEAVNSVRELNPDYDYELHDDEDCRNFLLSHFGQNYANAFDILIPGAFKCDFWRYAMLYVHGGVYLDIDMVPLVPFKDLIKDTDTLVSIVDHIVPTCSTVECGIYQAFIACEPKHPVMLYCLQLSFANIAMRRGKECDVLGITGPILMGIAMNLYWNKMCTVEIIKPGIYANGIVLYEMDSNNSYDLSGKPIFSNRFKGYERGPADYGKIKTFYRDPPKIIERTIFIHSKKWRNLCIILGIICIVLLYIVVKKSNNNK